jgi:hypothetical protein
MERTEIEDLRVLPVLDVWVLESEAGLHRADLVMGLFAFDDGIERWKAPSDGVPKKLGIPSQQTERHGN